MNGKITEYVELYKRIENLVKEQDINDKTAVKTIFDAITRDERSVLINNLKNGNGNGNGKTNGAEKKDTENDTDKSQDAEIKTAYEMMKENERNNGNSGNSRTIEQLIDEYGIKSKEQAGYLRWQRKISYGEWKKLRDYFCEREINERVGA